MRNLKLLGSVLRDCQLVCKQGKQYYTITNKMLILKLLYHNFLSYYYYFTVEHWLTSDSIIIIIYGIMIILKLFFWAFFFRGLCIHLSQITNRGKKARKNKHTTKLWVYLYIHTNWFSIFRTIVWRILLCESLSRNSSTETQHAYRMTISKYLYKCSNFMYSRYV